MLQYARNKLGKMFFKTRAYFPEGGEIGCYIDKLPDDLLEEIFLRLDGAQLCKSVNRVCKRWRDLLESDSFWTQMCIRDGKMNSHLSSILNKNQIAWSPKKTYFNNTFTKNLIKNPNGVDSFNYWYFDSLSMLDDITPRQLEEIIESCKKNRVVGLKLKSWDREWSNQLNSWSIESTQTGCSQNLNDKNGKLLTCFVTSYTLGEKMQVIDFQEEESIYKDIILRLDSEIEIKESYTARDGIKCYYQLRVFLISNDFDLIDSFSHSDYINTFPCPWKTVIHRFKVDPKRSEKPVRYVLFYHGGKVFEFLFVSY
jgi:hypothetical protein